MKSVKKLFFAFFTALTGLVLMATVTKVGASSSPVTPWTLSFDNGKIVNVNADMSGVNVVSNGFSITFNDPTGRSEGGTFDIWAECHGVIPYEPVIYEQYIANGQTMTYKMGGHLWINAKHIEYGTTLLDADFKSFFVDRSIITSGRIYTNLENGKYYYKDTIYFRDFDFLRDPDLDLDFEIKNLTTGAISNDRYLWISDNGKYEVTIKDLRKNQTRVYSFAIDKTAPIIQLYHSNWQSETPVLSGAITSEGMKVVYGDNIQVNSMRYEYRPFKGGYESGSVYNGFIFWRKGNYKITVTDMVGNTSVSTFTITDYDLLVDPKTAGTVGTEVTINKGEYGSPVMHVGYTRCIYLGPTAASQSRFDFNFTSSDESVATISVHGTITANGAGTTVITSVNKKDGKVGMIVITVLPK